jgi:hypothetical protein
MIRNLQGWGFFDSVASDEADSYSYEGIRNVRCGLDKFTGL